MHSSRSYLNILAVSFFAVFSFALTYTQPSEEVRASDTDEADKLVNTVRLNIVIPDTDTTTTTLSRHRIAANTDPGSRAYINGKEVRVYPTGGFAGLVDVPHGKSISKISIVTADGESRFKELYFNRPSATKTTPSQPLIIDEDFMKPDQSLELGNGEEIEIQFRGSSGQLAYFSIDGVTENIRMNELPLNQTKGVGGIYVGNYIIQEDDFAPDTRINYKLRDKQGGEITTTNNVPIAITPGSFPRTAEIVGRRAYLNADTGSDRLGGPRLGYLDEGIRVEVIGRTGGFYRIRLTDKLEGHLPLRFAKLLPEETPLPFASTGSVTVRESDNHDIVSLSLSQRLPYTTQMLTNPNSIEIDIFGAKSNTNWIANEDAAAGIKSVEWKQMDTNHFRLIIHLEHDIHWGYHVGYGVGSSLHIQVQHPPVMASTDRPLEDMRIVVDVGHGGSNRGAIGSTGSEEKNVVFGIAQKVRDRLVENGAQVLMTRDEDISVSMVDRSEMIIASDAHILISIHANSISTSTNPLAIHGTSSYYYHDAFKPLAYNIHSRLLELPVRDFGLKGNFNFTLNALTELPNVLVETGFMSHPEEEMNLLDTDYQDKMVEKIVDGIREYFLQYAQAVEYSF